MAVDTLLWEKYERWLDLPLLRFYGWEPFAVSLGHSQRLRDLDTEKIFADGMELVRRPTGGRAILHADELTYAVIISREDMEREAIYARANRWFFSLLEEMRLPVSLEEEQPDFRGEYRKPESAPCFSSIAKHEIKVGGRKIVGSAQRVGQQAILQHGSFMLGTKHLELLNYLGLGDETAAKAKEILKESATELNSWLKNDIDARAFSGKLADVIRKDGIELIPYPKTEQLFEAAEEVSYRFNLAEQVVR